ncbi:hypothetical protein HAX54_014699 [Datura stramonium]|uniref:Uncharacterized protein n=1 Tax=Datura stramonium TaxID=4076 RepID=A0ABS8TQD8_DATST|nr:hypothetical protein [Datura stramonium]
MDSKEEKVDNREDVRKSGETPVQTPVGFRPLFGICVTSTVRGSEPVTHCLISGGVIVWPVYCFQSASQRRSAYTIRRLAGAPPVLPVL